MLKKIIHKCLPQLEKEFLEEVEKYSITKKFLAKDYIIKQGQFIRSLPIVLKGNVKVVSQEDSIQFLLYYITQGEPCIFSFIHLLNDNPIEFSAIAELDSELLLLPIDKVRTWIRVYPSFSSMLLNSYEKHYKDLLETTKQIICFNLEERLLSYLKTKATIEQSNLLKVSHQQIADDLGTSREVISRLMKKMSLDKKVAQIGRKIKLL